MARLPAVGLIGTWVDYSLRQRVVIARHERHEARADGINADRWGEDRRRTTTEVTSASKLRIRLAEGGGWVGGSASPLETN